MMKSSVFYRDLNRVYESFAGGEGCYLIDREGRRYLDACGGVAVNVIGHGVERIAEALSKGIGAASYVYGAAFSSTYQEELARKLVSVSPLGDAKVFFSSGGSEANEGAIKMARQYHVERGEIGRWKVISRWLGYHGNTMATLSVSGRPSWRTIYDPYLMRSPKIDPPYCLRCPLGMVYPRCGLACADELERTILMEGPETVSAFIAEPILGTSVSAVVPVPGYYERIREICDRYGVLFIADEVLCGYGRTGKVFAIEHWDVQPDIITIGKGLGSGYAPLAATMASEKVVEAFEQGSGRFVHGFTFSGLPASCLVGNEVFDIISDQGLFERVEPMGEYLASVLRHMAESHKIVGDVRGLGLLAGIEFVADQESLEPFPEQMGLTERVVRVAEEKGLLLRQGTSGSNFNQGGDHVQISPPYVISEAEIDEMVDLLDQTLTDVEEELL
ncbi:MAG: aspartate aminotransferase family protein [Nitrospiraceae bacterium]|nr:aspartate aminotransferase family protein [Nitrospiraceae bacterium]